MEWAQRKDSILENQNLSDLSFILLLKCYQLGLSVETTNFETSVSSKIIKKYFKYFRNSLVLYYFGEDLKPQDSVNLSLSQSGEKITFTDKEILPIEPSMKIDIIQTKSIKGEYLYKYETQITGSSTKYITELQRFWRSRKQYFETFTGFGVADMFYYLLELVVRYNEEDQDFIDILTDSLGGSKYPALEKENGG